MLRGHLDAITHDRISGWAWDTENPANPVSLIISCNGNVVGRLLANRYRRDLELADIADGRRGFEFVFPTPLVFFERQDISVVAEADGRHVPLSPVVLDGTDRFDPEQRKALGRYLARESSEDVLNEKIDFLADQLDLLLQRRADQVSGRQERFQLQLLQRKWGAKALPQFEHEVGAVRKPRALIIDDRTPVADRDAGSNAILGHLRSLQRLGFVISFAASIEFGKRPELDSALEKYDVVRCALPHYASVEEVLRRQSGQFDLIYLHRLSNASKYGALARAHHPDATIVYSVADLHHLRIGRQSEIEQRPALLPLVRRLRLGEFSAAALADVVITHSSHEAQVLREALPHARVSVVPWDVSVRRVQASFQGRSGVAFIGGFGHEPNRDAARRIIAEISPALRDRFGIEVFLVGSELPGDIAKLCGQGVAALGHVADLHEIFERVRLTVAPLAYGAGVKGKVLDSLAAGVPCACTPIAAEGLPFPDLLQQCVGGTTDELIGIIGRLHTEEAHNRAVADAGLQMITTLCSAENVDAAMRDALSAQSFGRASSLAAE